MNLWIFHQNAFTPDMPGGTRHYDFAKELVRRGYKVTIFATSFHHHLHREMRLKRGELWKVEVVDGINFIWIRTPPYWRNDWRRVRNMIFFMLRAWFLGRKLPFFVPKISPPDVILGSSPQLLSPLAAFLVAKSFRVPFVMEVRDLWPQTIIDMNLMSARHPIIKSLQVLERFLYQRAYRIIIVPPRAYEYITACGIPREKIIWIPNGVDLSRFQGYNKSTGSGKSFQVMYLGAHGPANALDVLIYAAKVIQEKGYKQIRFILIGDGSQKNNLKALAKKLNVTNIEFRNSVPKNMIEKVLLEADAFLFNLEKIGVLKYGISSQKLFDYMITGKPVISSIETPDNPIERAKCGLIVPQRNPKALAEAIIKLYKMPLEKREEMGHRGKEYVEKNHAIPLLVDRLETCLKEVVDFK